MFTEAKDLDLLATCKPEFSTIFQPCKTSSVDEVFKPAQAEKLSQKLLARDVFLLASVDFLPPSVISRIR